MGGLDYLGGHGHFASILATRATSRSSGSSARRALRSSLASRSRSFSVRRWAFSAFPAASSSCFGRSVRDRREQQFLQREHNLFHGPGYEPNYCYDGSFSGNFVPPCGARSSLTVAAAPKLGPSLLK